MTKKEALILSLRSAADFLGGFSKDYSRSADQAVANRAKEAGTHAKAVLEVVRQFEKFS
jgi:coenzyme F420-reducing hydrogenase alpha subunit